MPVGSSGKHYRAGQTQHQINLGQTGRRIPEALPGQALEQIAHDRATCQTLGDDQTQTRTGTWVAAVTQVEILTTHPLGTGQDGGELRRPPQPVFGPEDPDPGGHLSPFPA